MTSLKFWIMNQLTVLAFSLKENIQYKTLYRLVHAEAQPWKSQFLDPFKEALCILTAVLCVMHIYKEEGGNPSNDATNPTTTNCYVTLISLLLTLQRSRRGRRVCSWGRHRGRCGWWLPAGSADIQSAPVRSGTFPPAVRSQWWLLLEEPGRSLCDLPCGQSDWDQGPSVLALGEDSDRAEVGKGHLYRRKMTLNEINMHLDKDYICWESCQMAKRHNSKRKS